MEGENTDGTDIGLAVAGNHVYVVCILVANYVVVQRCNNYTGYGEMLTALMCFAAFFFMYVESALDMQFPQLYLVFGPMYTQSSIWDSMFFGIVQAWVFEFFVSRFTSLILPHFDFKTWTFKDDGYKDLEDEQNPKNDSKDENEGGMATVSNTANNS